MQVGYILYYWALTVKRGSDVIIVINMNILIVSEVSCHTCFLDLCIQNNQVVYTTPSHQ